MTEAPPPRAAAPELKPFLTYSLGAHLAVAGLFSGLLGRSAGPAQTVYTIDFVGPSGGVAVAGPAGGRASPSGKDAAPARPAAPPKPAPQADFDEFGRRRRHGPLPRPSLLRGWSEKPDRAERRAAAPAKAAASSSAEAGEDGSGGGGPAGEAGIATDMPNFPYPWYITRVRTALWNQWAERMPRQAGETVAVFSIRPNGEVVDLRTEESSGDSAFDLAALGAVQDAGPFPPLPPGFREPFLKIHVTLKSQ